MEVEKDLINICEKVASKLVLIPRGNETKDNEINFDTRLIFPSYQNDRKKVRISEQESRILFCQEADIYKKYYYAIEVPTASKYSFTGSIQKDENGQSARSDLSLFCQTSNSDNRTFEQIVNVEFKAHNANISHIMKDLLKLVAEPAHGLFFHTLHTINSGTLVNDGECDGIIDKYKKIKEYEDKFMEPTAGGSKFILFAICIIEKKILLLKTFHKNKFDSIDDFFSINRAKVCGAEIPETNKGWTQIRLK